MLEMRLFYVAGKNTLGHWVKESMCRCEDPEVELSLYCTYMGKSNQIEYGTTSKRLTGTNDWVTYLELA